MNKTIEIINNHRSVRKFTDEALTGEQLFSIVNAAQRAATSSFTQSYSIIRVKDSAIRKQMSELAGGQPYVVSAAEFLVFCGDIRRAEFACKHSGKEFHGGSMEDLLVAVVDASLVAQNAVIAAESMGLGTVYIGAIRANLEQVVQLLAIPKYVIPLFGLCIGHPAGKSETRPRLPMTAVLMEDQYVENKQSLLDFNMKAREYYSKRVPPKDADWFGPLAKMFSLPASRQLREFFAKQGFSED